MAAYPYALTVTNPGAETGDTTGWTDETAVLQSITTYHHTGSRCFAWSYVPAGAASQVIDLPAEVHADVDAGGVSALVDWWQKGLATFASERMEIEALSAGDITLDAVGATLVESGTAWENRNLSLLLPANTRKVLIRMVGIRLSGSGIPAYFDDIVLSLTGSPAPVGGDVAPSGPGLGIGLGI